MLRRLLALQTAPLDGRGGARLLNAQDGRAYAHAVALLSVKRHRWDLPEGSGTLEGVSPEDVRRMKDLDFARCHLLAARLLLEDQVLPPCSAATRRRRTHARMHNCVRMHGDLRLVLY